MATEGIKEGDWLFDTMIPYYDELQQHALAVRGAAFEAFSEDDRKQASNLVSGRVQALANRFDNDLLPKAALSMIEDLYRAGLNATVWGPGYSSYIAAVWGTMFEAVKDRGYTLRYVVENTWPDNLNGPVKLFPSLFGSAGIWFVCPSVFASELPELEGAPLTTAGLKRGLSEGRTIALMAAKKLVKQGKHFAYFETDYDPGCLKPVFALPKPAGTIEIFQSEIPKLNVNVKLSITPLEERPTVT